MRTHSDHTAIPRSPIEISSVNNSLVQLIDEALHVDRVGLVLVRVMLIVVAVVEEGEGEEPSRPLYATNPLI